MQDIKSVTMTTMNGLEFQCANSNCLPFVTTTAPNILQCQIHCLRQPQCKAATFQETTCKCQLFNNITDQNSNLQANIQVTTMIVISGTRIPLVRHQLQRAQRRQHQAQHQLVRHQLQRAQRRQHQAQHQLVRHQRPRY
ncbi:unnamed protein product [Adineta ricciae]|uniref:Apple domain-containing protein n=1 Tax=Adineta ricciae TaxID=249248 RepID=A0A814KK82_ADIRI|nr:unnamed protein product [Adineta ricciae]